MKMRFCFLCSLLQVACANTELLRQSDYRPVTVNLREGKIEDARAAFPHKREEGGFITTVENGYLNWLAGKPDPKPLLKVSDDLARRQMILISEEASQFFYQETEEGYYPAEHEIIWLYLLTGYNFAEKGDRENARVEAQKAAQKLQGHNDSPTGDFDDPALRLMLAGLWIYCDEWEHAAVDLRRAAELSPDLAWAKKLADGAAPPASFNLILEGIGPELFGSRDDLKFPLRAAPEALNFRDARTAAFSTRGWYRRHLKRNTAIRDVLMKSKYMIHSGAVHGAATAGQGVVDVMTGAIYVTGAVIIVGVVAGAAYLLGNSGGGGSQAVAYIAGGGIALGSTLFDAGHGFFKKQTKEIENYKDENLDLARTYRYVRFIPDWIATAVSKTSDLQIHDDRGLLLQPFSRLSDSAGRSRVSIYFVN